MSRAKGERRAARAPALVGSSPRPKSRRVKLLSCVGEFVVAATALTACGSSPPPASDGCALGCAPPASARAREATHVDASVATNALGGALAVMFAGILLLGAWTAVW